MFSNIGSKIKSLAKVITWIGILASLISAISLWIVSADSEEGEIYIAGGFGILIFGSLLSWLGSFFIYGFGELIEATVNIEKQLKSSDPESGGANTNLFNEKPKIDDISVNKSENNFSVQIEELNGLLMQNLITQEEYDEMCKKINPLIEK